MHHLTEIKMRYRPVSKVLGLGALDYQYSNINELNDYEAVCMMDYDSKVTEE